MSKNGLLPGLKAGVSNLRNQDEEYFDQEYAKVDSKEKALEKVWGLVGFLKKSYP